MHQQVYYKWLERAYQGGLRLMVMMAVNSERSIGRRQFVLIDPRLSWRLLGPVVLPVAQEAKAMETGPRINNDIFSHFLLEHHKI